jgi:hypothetical protein
MFGLGRSAKVEPMQDDLEQQISQLRTQKPVPDNNYTEYNSSNTYTATYNDNNSMLGARTDEESVADEEDMNLMQILFQFIPYYGQGSFEIAGKYKV